LIGIANNRYKLHVAKTSTFIAVGMVVEHDVNIKKETPDFRDKIGARSNISLLYVKPELFNAIFDNSLTNIDSFLKKQSVLAVGSKGRWLPPFTTGPGIGQTSTVRFTYPLFEWTKKGRKELVRAKPLKLQSPPTTEGETSAETDNITTWDKVVPGTILRVKFRITAFQNKDYIWRVEHGSGRMRRSP